jgi:hypothetical protein
MKVIQIKFICVHIVPVGICGEFEPISPFLPLHPQPARRLQPIRDLFHRLRDIVIGNVQVQPGQARFGYQPLHQFLLADEDLQVVVLVGLAGDFQALGPCGGEGGGGAVEFTEFLQAGHPAVTPPG